MNGTTLRTIADLARLVARRPAVVLTGASLLLDAKTDAELLTAARILQRAIRDALAEDP